MELLVFWSVVYNDRAGLQIPVHCVASTGRAQALDRRSPITFLTEQEQPEYPLPLQSPNTQPRNSANILVDEHSLFEQGFRGYSPFFVSRTAP